MISKTMLMMKANNNKKQKKHKILKELIYHMIFLVIIRSDSYTYI